MSSPSLQDGLQAAMSDALEAKLHELSAENVALQVELAQVQDSRSSDAAYAALLLEVEMLRRESEQQRQRADRSQEEASQ